MSTKSTPKSKSKVATSTYNAIKPSIDVDLDMKCGVGESVVDASARHVKAFRVLPPAAAAHAAMVDTMVCPLAGRVHVILRSARIIRIADGRRGVFTLTLRASRNAHANLMDVDDAMLTQIRASANEWFAGIRTASVDEFFRASTATDRTEGIVARMSLEAGSAELLDANARVGEDVDATLQLVGMRFLRQHIDILWRLVAVARSTSGKTPAFFELFDEDEYEDNYEDDNDPAVLGPTPDERDAMFVDLSAKLDVQRIATDARLRELDALADKLEVGREAGDNIVLDAVFERLACIHSGTQAHRET